MRSKSSLLLMYVVRQFKKRSGLLIAYLWPSWLAPTPVDTHVSIYFFLFIFFLDCRSSYSPCMVLLKDFWLKSRLKKGLDKINTSSDTFIEHVSEDLNQSSESLLKS